MPMPALQHDATERLATNPERNEKDFWEFDEHLNVIHVQPTKRLFAPVGKDAPFDSDKITSHRSTEWKCRGRWSTYDEDDWRRGSPNRRISSRSWTGVIWFFPKEPVDIKIAKVSAMKANLLTEL